MQLHIIIFLNQRVREMLHVNLVRIGVIEKADYRFF
jgi:hypothetical protein